MRFATTVPAGAHRTGAPSWQTLQLTALRSQVAGMDWLPPAIAEHRAAQIRSGAGGLKTGLPLRLLEARRERDLQVQDLAEAEAAHNILVADHQQAQADHARAQAGKIAVVTAIQLDRAMSMFAELRSVEMEAAGLRRNLMGFQQARTISEGLPPGALGLLAHDVHHAALIAAYEAALPRPSDWSKWRRDLLEFADAGLGGPGAGVP